MRLSKKLTYYFTTIVFISLTFGFFIFYFAVERATIQSAIGKLENLNQKIEDKLKHQSIDNILLQHPHVKIRILSEKDKNLVDEVVREGNYEWNEMLQTMVNHVSVTTYPFVNNVHYEIQSRISITIIDNEYFIGIVMVVAWIFVFIIITIIFFSELITRNLYTPFYYLLEQMKRFDVRENQQLEILKSDIIELNQLNDLFVKTSTQSIEHYESLKEFTQNLSHELQTPIANIKGKIELMLNSEISEEQMVYLSKMYDDLNKVSIINRSLVLLMSLDHHQKKKEEINLSESLKEIVQDQEELIYMNGVAITTELSPDIYIEMDKLLADIMLSNLISNANRHNVKNGEIFISLSQNRLIIKNTGREQEFSNETIFQRFKKGKYNSESIGIGLALVKKICMVYHFDISYQFNQNWHQFEIIFLKNEA